MLRAILILIGLVLLACGLFAVRFYGVAGFPPLAAGALLLLGTLFEGRYRPRVRAGTAGWEPTGERFIDPLLAVAATFPDVRHAGHHPGKAVGAFTRRG